MTVSYAIVPVLTSTPCAFRCRFTCPRICSPSWCASSKCRNLQTVVSSATASQPRSMPTNCRITTESYSASSTAGSDRLNHCCKKVNPQHALHSHGWPTVPRLGIMWFHHTAQLAPRHHLLHLLQKYRSPCL